MTTLTRCYWIHGTNKKTATKLKKKITVITIQNHRYSSRAMGNASGLP